jgi:hypothetical protein
MNRPRRDPTDARKIGLGLKPADRLEGLGQTTTVGDSVMTCGFTQVPVIEYVTWTVDLPVPNAAIDATFGDEINVLQTQGAPAGVTSSDSSFVMNGLLQVDMLVIGFGVHAFAEPQQGSQIGNWFNPAPGAGAVPVSPDAFTTDDITAILAGSTSTTITPAILEWGVCAQNAIWHMMNGYQFQWIAQQRYLLIDELAADVSYFGSYAEALGAGSSQEAFQRYVNRVNQKYGAGLGSTGAFVPINAQRIGSTSTGATTSAGVYHPTRAYDLMDVTWGGLRAQGASGHVQPFRKLFKPILLERGIPIGMFLRAQDAYHQALMQQYLEAVENGVAAPGGIATLMQIGSGASGNTTLTINELTFPNTTTPTTLQVEKAVNTDRVLVKGGALQLAFLIKGFEVWGPWKQYILNKLVPGGLVGTPSSQ